jgi:uncharacterized protein (TIGR00288 family)
MALFCDFENVALGVRDAKYEKFNIKPVLERLLLKGSIVVKKAYCDWERYKEFKSQMHEAAFELIEIPHVRQSGKNSADIRMVVDALDLCYTKSHVDCFVIISGDSDFSPLVSKLRENAKYVIGVGVKSSTSDLLISNCDEFIFIDDLVRESRREAAIREVRKTPPAARRSSDDDHRSKEEVEARKSRAIDMVTETFDALMAERGDSGKIWASALKQAIKRRKPDFSETSFGFRTFGALLEEAQSRGLLDIGRDEKSGAYVYRSNPAAAAGDVAAASLTPASPDGMAGPAAAVDGKRGTARNGRAGVPKPASNNTAASAAAPAEPEMPTPSAALVQTVTAESPDQKQPRRQGRGVRKPVQKQAQATEEQSTSAAFETPMAAPSPAADAAGKTARKPAARTRRPRKAEATPLIGETKE